MTFTKDTIRIVVFDNPEFAPSRLMLTAVRELAVERFDIDVEHVDVWQDPNKAIEYDVMTVPTTIILAGRVEQKRLCGLRSSRAIRRAIDHIQAQQPAQIQKHQEIQTATAG